MNEWILNLKKNLVWWEIKRLRWRENKKKIENGQLLKDYINIAVLSLGYCVLIFVWLNLTQMNTFVNSLILSSLKWSSSTDQLHRGNGGRSGWTHLLIHLMVMAWYKHLIMILLLSLSSDGNSGNGKEIIHNAFEEWMIYWIG